jgi:DNA-binding NarL/FixJ family response regulator
MSLSSSASDRLTDRERQVLEVLAAGNRISDIAAELYVSEKTVKNHLTSVYAKLGAETAAQAVAIAYRTGLVSTLHPYG